jgi:hypothetical protein
MSYHAASAPRQAVIWCAIAACALLAPSRIIAQSTFATLTGIVTDQSGALMPGVTLTMTKEATGAERSVVTDGAGRYQFVNIDAGPYRIAAHIEGFADQTREIDVLSRQVIKYDFQLLVAAAAETVQVSVITPVIETNVRPSIARSRATTSASWR